jgi:cell wall-associated NlpC family hydrolase
MRGRVGAVAVSLLSAACLVTGTAWATPTTTTTAPDKAAQADQLAQKLDDQGQRIAAFDEQFNQARAKADAIDAQLATIGPKLADSDRQLTAARQRLAEASVDAYVRGGASPLLGALIKGNANDFGVRKTYVDAALDGQRGALAQFDAARKKLLATRDQLRSAQRQARATANAIEASRQAIQATAAAQQSTMNQVQGDMAGLVAQAAAARAQTAEQQGKQKFNTLAAPAASTPTSAAPRVSGTAAPKPAPAGSAARPASPPTTAHPGSPPATSAPKPSSPPPAPTGPAPAVKAGAATAVNVARAQLGKPYVYGAAGPDTFDCSGLTMYAWRAGGVGLPHSAEMQYNSIAHIAVSQLQPGDLVFFYTPIEHVGIYVGGGQMIDAPYTGAVVRYDSIYRTSLVGAGRP